MKFTLLLSIYLLIIPNCYSQADKVDDLSKMKKDVITLEVPDVTSSIDIHISQLIVIDARPDSSSFGFYKASSGKNFSIATETNSANDVSDFISQYLQLVKINPALPSVIMVLKKLWLTNELIEDGIESVNKKNANGSWQKGAIAKIEFYYGFENSYVPLYRFDTLYADTKFINDYGKDYIRNVLIMSVQKLISADLTKVSTTRKKMSLKDIIAYSRKGFDFPITGTNIYKQGVYKTFDEFKMNDPSITNFEIRKDKLNEIIFVKDGNAEYPVRDVWGFSDGNRLYIQSADNYFRLIKKQNTFICSSAKDLSRKRVLKIGNVLMFGMAGTIGKENKKVEYSIKLRPYQLDIETGELY